jgi:hypothetical protein
MPDATRPGLDPTDSRSRRDGGAQRRHGDPRRRESPSAVLRLTRWRARSVARVLQEWSSVSRIFYQASWPHLDERTVADARVGRRGAR